MGYAHAHIGPYRHATGNITGFLIIQDNLNIPDDMLVNYRPGECSKPFGPFRPPVLLRALPWNLLFPLQVRNKAQQQFVLMLQSMPSCAKA